MRKPQLNENKVRDLNKKIQSMKKAQIILYGILLLYDKAVKLALECDDIEMAKQYANKPVDKKIRKKLWMKIAKHLFKAKGRNGR